MSLCGSILNHKERNEAQRAQLSPRAKALGYNTPPFQGGVPYKGKAY